MVYRWNLEGTALEFPSPFALENRFLVWRGYALIALALAVMVVVSYVGDNTAVSETVALEDQPEKGSVVPHMVGALLMALWGALNLVQASRQRVLQLLPGQPASLMAEISHEAVGISAGATWLMQAMGRGVASAPAVTGPYAAWMRRLSADVGAAPSSLHGYLRLHLAHLVLHVGLALLFGLGWLASLALAKPAALPLVALLVGLLGTAMLTRHRWQAEAAEPTPLLLTLLLAFGLLAAAPLVWFADVLPGAARLERLGLPLATALLLGLGLLVEVLALWAARRQIVAPRPARMAADEVSVSFDADPGQLFGDIGRELYVRWAEGIPSRRYGSQPPVFDAAAEEGNLAAVMLEESQPLVPDAPAGSAPRSNSRWALVLLDGVGLALSVAGGLLLLWLAYAHMVNDKTSWLPGSLGLLGLGLGGYALHIGHLLWSRVEVSSTLTWLDFKGSYYRVSGATATAAGQRSEPGAVAVDELTVRATVAQARSAYYTAVPRGIGSRALLALVPDAKAAAHWTGFVQTWARNAALAPNAATTAVRAARALVRERRAGAPDAPAQPRRPARFCSVCGTPLLAGARFCQQCGSSVAPD